MVKTHTLLSHSIVFFWLTLPIRLGWIINNPSLGLIYLGFLALISQSFIRKFPATIPDRCHFKSSFIPEDSIQFPGFWSNSNQSDKCSFYWVKLVSLHCSMGLYFPINQEDTTYDGFAFAFAELPAFLRYPIWLEKVRFESRNWLGFEFASLSSFLKNWPAATSVLGFCLPEFILFVTKIFSFSIPLQLILLLLRSWI